MGNICYTKGHNTSLVNYVYKSCLMYLTAVLVLSTSQVEKFCGVNSGCAALKQEHDSMYYNCCTVAVWAFTLRE